jgi:hypothetical protein
MFFVSCVRNQRLKRSARSKSSESNSYYIWFLKNYNKQQPVFLMSLCLLDLFLFLQDIVGQIGDC